MANLSNVIKISKTDYDTLVGGGTITKNGVTYSYDPNAIYLIAPEAVGSATQPIYINNNGDFVAGNTMVDLTSTQTITGTKTFSQYDGLKVANVKMLDYSAQDYTTTIEADYGAFYFHSNTTGQNPEWIAISPYDGAIMFRSAQSNTTQTYGLPGASGTLALTSDIPSSILTYSSTGNYSVAGTTKTTYTYAQTTIYAPNGLIMGGTAAAAGLVTRGVCGVSTPSTGGACTKENLYVNYDGDNTYRNNRQVVLQAGSVGTHYGNNVYQYCAVRGDALNSTLQYLTTAPTQANTSGQIKIVVLSSEPATKYAGYIYLITE